MDHLTTMVRALMRFALRSEKKLDEALRLLKTDKQGVQLQELRFPGQVCPLCNQQKAYLPVPASDQGETEVIVVCGCTPRLTPLGEVRR